ncbi:TPA: site-specific integrase [Pseudomonas aeruginosa]|nr:site-specific integrase [Pseudomonas aeruginosa]
MPNTFNYSASGDQPQISPDSPHAQLLTMAKDRGRDVGVIAEMLRFLDVHPQLIDFPRVIQGLVNTLDAMDVPPVLNLGASDLRIWRDECRWIISIRNNPDFVAALGLMFYQGDERRTRNPVIGKGVQEHAFPYATLWHEPADSECEQDYYRLIGQLLLAYQQRADGLGLRGQRYTAYLELRALCALQTLSIPSDLNIWSSSAVFAQGCRQFDAGNSTNYLAEYFAPIVRLARYLGGEEPPERHGGGGHRHHGGSNSAGLGVLISQGATEFPLDDPDDPDLLPGYISFVVSQPLDDDLDEALPPGELTAASEICLIDTRGEVRPYVAELLSHEGMLAHIARSRQFLPFGYNLLTQYELANLLFGVTDEFLFCRERIRNAPGQEQTQIRRRLEALLVLHLMLWFGRSLEDCKKLRIAERNARPSSVLELVLTDETGPAEFRFFAPTPDYAAEELLPRDAVRASQPTISVPDMVGAAALVMAIRDLSPVNGSAVITCKIKDVEREIRILLGELGGEDPRYTMHKVRSYLHRQIIADSHDVVAATMLSGMPCLSANTALYYSQYSINYLRRLYCQSVQRVLAAVYATVGLEAPSAPIPAVPEAAIGARNCLRLDTVKANLEALLIVLRKRPRKNLQQLVHWHNCFSLWTVQMFFMATGCRAIRDPLKHEDEFISPGGHGALGDKGSDDGHMSRLVVLTDLLRRQLKAYKAHCRAITGQLELHAPAPTNGFFLRLTDDGCLSYEEIRPLHIKAVMRQIEGFTPHAVNGFRKFLRTELAERGCPPETLSALMGHWLSGEEPQDIYSSFCPRTYVQSLHAHLLPLMRELGWTVRNSHLVAEADV